MSGPSLRDLDGHDPYQLLGVPPTATRAEIVAAHRTQVQLVHPDRPGGDEYETKLLHIAKEILLDPKRRAEYDEHATRADNVGNDDPFSETEYSSAWDSEDVVIGPEVRPSPQWSQRVPEYPFTPPTENYWQPTRFPSPPSVWRRSSASHYAPRSNLSTVLLVASVMSLLCCAPVGLVLGIIALRRVRERGESGQRNAVSAIVVSALLSIYFIVLIAVKEWPG